jgi:4-diphosphocytidyl-2-C-methyl-D-erythritol kinase
MGGRIVRFAPAKLNLTLAVAGQRPDGFHALHSVMVPLAFGDEVELEPSPSAMSDRLDVEGPDELGAGPDNLVLRAIEAMRTSLRVRRAQPNAGPASKAGAAAPPLTARLIKRIPVAAGLGGGSSDAAATIAAALEAWGASLPAPHVADVAASLGSDVPFFLAGSAGLVTGRGEFVDPLPPFRGEAPAVLIVTPRLCVATSAVFAAYAAGARPSAAEAATTLAVSERLAADMLAGMTAPALLERGAELAAANDLMPAALAVAPALGPFREALARLLGRPIGLSGSGPTSWILYPGRRETDAAAEVVRRAVAGGSLPAIAQGEPFVAATAIRPVTASAPDAPPPTAGAATAHNGGGSSS